MDQVIRHLEPSLGEFQIEWFGNMIPRGNIAPNLLMLCSEEETIPMGTTGHGFGKPPLTPAFSFSYGNVVMGGHN